MTMNIIICISLPKQLSSCVSYLATVFAFHTENDCCYCLDLQNKIPYIYYIYLVLLKLTHSLMLRDRNSQYYSRTV